MSRDTNKGSRESAELLAFHLKAWDPNGDPAELIARVGNVPGVLRVEFNPRAGRLIVLGSVDTASLNQALRELGLELEEEGEEERDEALSLRVALPRANLGQWLVGSRTWLRSLAWIVPSSFLVGVLLSLLATAPGPVPTVWVVGAGVALFGTGLLLGGRRLLQRYELDNDTYFGRTETALLLLIVLIAQISLGDWLLSLVLLLFYGVVQLLPGYVVRRLEKQWVRPLEQLPRQVHVITGTTSEAHEIEMTVVPVEQVSPEDIVYVRAGDVVVFDGYVEEGSEAVLNTSAVTGDAIPHMPAVGSLVPAGAKVDSGELYLRVKCPFQESILFDLRPKDAFQTWAHELLSERFVALHQYFPQVIIYVATAVMVLPPLLFGEAIGPWLQRGLAVLLIAPINTLVFGLVGPILGVHTRMAELGTAFRSRAELAQLGRTTVLALAPSVVVDPRHTLTRIETYAQLSEDDALRIAASLVQRLEEPWSTALCEAAAGQGFEPLAPLQLGPMGSEGVVGTLRTGDEDDQFSVGTTQWMVHHGVELPHDVEQTAEDAASAGSSLVWLAYKQRVLAVFFIQSRVKDGIRRLVQKLRRTGIRRVFLAGTHQEPLLKRFAEQAGLDGGFGSATPQDVNSLLEGWKDQGEVVAYVASRHDVVDHEAPLLEITLGSHSVSELGEGRVHMVSGDVFQLHPVFAVARRYRRALRLCIAIVLGAKVGMVALATQAQPDLWLLGLTEAAGSVLVASLVMGLLRRV